MLDNLKIYKEWTILIALMIERYMREMNVTLEEEQIGIAAGETGSRMTQMKNRKNFLTMNQMHFDRMKSESEWKDFLKSRLSLKKKLNNF